MLADPWVRWCTSAGLSLRRNLLAAAVCKWHLTPLVYHHADVFPVWGSRRIVL